MRPNTVALLRLEPNSQTPKPPKTLKTFPCADFYLYDETPDDHQLKYWQWPRVDPTDNFFYENGFCEDGSPSTTGRPEGEYHLTFGGPACADASVVASETGAYAGCGRQAYTPCNHGRDCADCGRAHSVASATYSDAQLGRQRELRAQDTSARRLPPPSDTNATLAFLRTVKRGLANGIITDFALPRPHVKLLESL